MDGHEGHAALVLTGGGARAAYQVGVLNAIRELRGKRAGNPFPILCGTSAGAINAAALAVHAGDFSRAVRHIDRIWRDLHVHDVYRVDPAALLGSGVRWGSALFGGWMVRQTPRALLDNAPLHGLLGRVLDLAAIDPAIKRGDLHAVSITASGYSTGESLAFFQGAPELQPWRRAQRLGVRTEVATRERLVAQVRASATVEVDETRLFAVAPRFEGWIETLHANQTGMALRRGARHEAGGRHARRRLAGKAPAHLAI